MYVVFNPSTGQSKLKICSVDTRNITNAKIAIKFIAEIIIKNMVLFSNFKSH